MLKPIRKRTSLSEKDEKAFQVWYADYAGKTKLDANPDGPRHKYDYRGAWKAMQSDEGMGPRVDPQDKQYHLPSQFKDFDHPTRLKTFNGFTVDTRLSAGVTRKVLRRGRSDK